MKQEHLCLVFIVFVLFSSCSSNGKEGSGTFWAQNMSNGKFYSVNAVLLGEAEFCNVWVEKGSNVNTETAIQIANYFDDVIYPTMIDVFGFDSVTIDGEEFKINTLEAADLLLGNRDGKLCILLLDIKDDYKEDVNNSYVAGYFWEGNFINYKHSNMRDMIYMDINPGKPGSDEFFATLAHETQHLMNYAMSCFLRNGQNMDIWINEGLSCAAERECTLEHSKNRIRWFNNEYNYSGLIREGNNFFVWDNHKVNQYAVLDDYATVYLFFQWLRLQANSMPGANIFYDIISSPDINYRAVVNAAKEHGIANNDDDWDFLLKTWLAANYINDPDSLYGYRGDSDLLDIKIQTVGAETTSIMLAPGEGVYSVTNSGFSFPAYGTNIKYAGLDKVTKALNDNGVFDGGVLLTYNANADRRGTPESGITTGSQSMDFVTSRRSLPSPLSEPLPIGAGDMLRKNGN